MPLAEDEHLQDRGGSNVDETLEPNKPLQFRVFTSSTKMAARNAIVNTLICQPD